ncbi:MATE family efflux transporter [Treponema sp.]|uniref:MATE family efflux transporter n=1 Tax=Treponema sp. TaxID=166 RepID=UPI0025EEF1C2|nr:MATE family efflux transporter [Treponema sp.]MCR5218583.1 MATE family efflux transporter [Treponema sp.]
MIFEKHYNGAMNTSVSLTSGSISKNILIFSLPLMFTNMLQVLFNMADVMVAGHFAGKLALAGVGSTSMLIFLFTGFLIGLGSGINVLSAFYLGARNQKMLDETVGTSFIFSLITGILFMITGIVFARPILILMKTRPELLDNAVLYFKLYMIALPASAIYNCGNGILTSGGDTRRPLIILSCAGVLNIGLNIFFVVFMKLSVAGVALGTVISQYLSAGLIVFVLCKGEKFCTLPESDGFMGNVRLNFRNLHLSRNVFLRLIKLGIPAGFQNAIFYVANIFIQVGVNHFDSAIIAGCAASHNAETITFDCMAAFYTAGASFTGQNYGAKKKNRILKSYLVSTGYAAIVSLIFGGIFLLFGRQFIGLFNGSRDVIEGGYIRLVIMALSMWISAPMDATTSASRGLGKTAVPSLIIILGSCIFRIIWIYTIFAHFMTVRSLFILFPVSWAITAFAEVLYFIRIYRRCQ